jgi:hypothetical protein
MTDARLLQVLGAFAVLGGVLRTGSTFIPWDGSDAIETLAFVIDVCLLFGLIGVYLSVRAQVGWFGFAAFAVALTGIASIVGPDGMMFGINTYQLGTLIIVAGLVAFSIAMLVRRAGSRLAAVLWIASPIVAIASTMANQPENGFSLGGILFGLGFVVAGLRLVSPGNRAEQAA